MTPASDQRPTRRVVSIRSASGFENEPPALMVIELRGRTLSLRPKGAKRGGPADYEMSYAVVYQREAMARADARRRQHKKGRGR